MFLIDSYRFAASGAVTTWNPSDKSAGMTLTNGNLTGAGNTNLNWICARGTTSRTGKRHFELFANAESGSYPAIGVANSSHSLSGYPGQTVHSIGWFGNGTVFYNGSAIGSADTYVTGDTLAVEVEAGVDIRFMKAGGTWSSPFSVSGISGAIFPLLCVTAIANTGTANFGQSAFAIAPTSGFAAWG